MDTNPLHYAFIEAGQQAGYKYNPDFNGEEQEGVGPVSQNIDNGRRASTAYSFIEPVKNRTNLTIYTNSVTSKLLFEKNKCIGVEFLRKNQLENVFADRAVIVCGGAINSAQILLLSGIGKAAYLTKWDLNVMIDLHGLVETQ